MGKFVYEQNEKSGIKKIILVIIFIILIGILGFLIYEVKFAEKNIFDNGNKYEEYDPNYKLEDNSNKKEEQSNINESNVTSNIAKKESDSNDIKVTGIKLSDSNFNMVVGDTKQLKATIIPDNATNKSVKWTSSNPKVATIDSTGKVVAKAKGSTVITVTAPGGGISVKTSINVTDKKIPVTNLAIKYNYVSYHDNGIPALYTYNTTSLSAVITPSNATDKSIKWTSSNPKVATVDSKGKVTAVAKGETIITATASNNVKATQKIIVATNPYVFKVDCYISPTGPKGYSYHCSAGVYKNGTEISYSSIKTNSKIYTASQLSNDDGDYSEFEEVKTVTLTYSGLSHVIPVEYTRRYS